MSARRLAPADLIVGRPVPFSVYSTEGILLLAAGSLLVSEAQRRHLLARDVRLDLSHPAPGGWSAPVSAESASASSMLITAVGQAAAADAESRRTLKAFPPLRTAVEAVQLTFDNDGQRLKCPVDYIGLVRQRSLLVSAPLWQGEALALPNGTLVAVRLFAGKSIYLFETTVLRSCTSPFFYIHLAVPAQVSEMDFRRRQRVQTALVATVRTETTAALSVKIVNLSTTGARLEAKQALGQRGDGLRLGCTVNIDGAKVTLDVPCVVRNAGGAQAGEVAFAGVEFVDLPLTDKLAIHAYLNEALDG